MPKDDPYDSGDPFTVLGIAPDADQVAIKSAYRHLAKCCHPDMNPGDSQAEKRFKKIQWAYEVLTKPRNPGVGDGIPGNGRRRGGFGSYAFAVDHPFFAFFEALRRYNSCGYGRPHGSPMRNETSGGEMDTAKDFGEDDRKG